MNVESQTEQNQELTPPLPQAGESKADFETAVDSLTESLKSAIKSETDTARRAVLKQLAETADEYYAYIDGETFTDQDVEAMAAIKARYESLLQSVTKTESTRGGEFHRSEVERLLEEDPDRLANLLEWVRRKKNARREAIGYRGREHLEAQQHLAGLRQVDLDIAQMNKLIAKIKVGKDVKKSRADFFKKYQELLADYKEFYENSRGLHRPSEPADPIPEPRIEPVFVNTEDTDAARQNREDVERQFDTVRIGSGVYAPNNSGMIISGGAKVNTKGGSLINQHSKEGSSIIEKTGSQETPTASLKPASATGSEPIPSPEPKADREPTPEPGPDLDTVRQQLEQVKGGVERTIDNQPSFSPSLKNAAKANFLRSYLNWKRALQGTPETEAIEQVVGEYQEYIRQLRELLQAHEEKRQQATADGKQVFEDAELAEFFGLPANTKFWSEARKELEAGEYKYTLNEWREVKKKLTLVEKELYSEKMKELIKEARQSRNKEELNKYHEAKEHFTQLKAEYALALQKVLNARKNEGLSEHDFEYYQANMGARFFGKTGNFEHFEGERKVHAKEMAAKAVSVGRDTRSYAEKKAAFERETLSEHKANLVMRVLDAYSKKSRYVKAGVGAAVAAGGTLVTGAALPAVVIGSLLGAVVSPLANKGMLKVLRRRVENQKLKADETWSSSVKGFDAAQFIEQEESIEREASLIDKKERQNRIIAAGTGIFAAAAVGGFTRLGYESITDAFSRAPGTDVTSGGGATTGTPRSTTFNGMGHESPPGPIGEHHAGGGGAGGGTEAAPSGTETAPTGAGASPEAAESIYQVHKGDNLWKIMEGRGGGGRAMSEALQAIAPEHRDAALVELFKQVDADPALRDAIGMQSEDADLIFTGENLEHLNVLDEKLHEIAVQHDGWLEQPAAAAPAAPTGEAAEAPAEATPAQSSSLFEQQSRLYEQWARNYGFDFDNKDVVAFTKELSIRHLGPEWTNIILGREQVFRLLDLDRITTIYDPTVASTVSEIKMTDLVKGGPGAIESNVTTFLPAAHTFTKQSIENVSKLLSFVDQHNLYTNPSVTFKETIEKLITDGLLKVEPLGGRSVLSIWNGATMQTLTLNQPTA